MISSVSDIAECIEQGAVEIKYGGAKRHIYREQLSLTPNVTSEVAVPSSVIKPLLNLFVDKLMEQRRNGKPQLTDRSTKRALRNRTHIL